jgi:hypothetical protein
VSLRSVIARQPYPHYWLGMAAAVLRLFALFALVLMLLGMASAPAASHAPMAAAPAEHCADRSKPDQAPAPKAMDCLATCTALPASEAVVPAPPPVPSPPRLIALADRFVGIVPEIATPPPKRG